jgi:hypothetical protein
LIIAFDHLVIGSLHLIIGPLHLIIGIAGRDGPMEQSPMFR